jgi:S1-C subfamily serine protease
VTFGFVSGVERTFRGPRGRRITGSVEHTAPLLPGSSGGPVLDAGGRLLAINTHRLETGSRKRRDSRRATGGDDAARQR